jgi:hypothetical protein
MAGGKRIVGFAGVRYSVPVALRQSPVGPLLRHQVLQGSLRDGADGDRGHHVVTLPAPSLISETGDQPDESGRAVDNLLGGEQADRLVGFLKLWGGLAGDRAGDPSINLCRADC